MDAVSYSLASKQAQRIEKFIENPDSASGIVTVPKTIASGETITIPAGRIAVLPNVQVDGELNIEGEVFIPSGATFADLESQIALKANINSPVFTGNPTAKDLSYKSTSVTISSWSYSTTTITLNVTSHTFVAGDYIEVTGLTATTYPANGIFLVTSVTPTTIVFTQAVAPTGTAGVSSATVKGYTTINGRVSESIGVNQTWKDVGASRSVGVTYTNTTGKPIVVAFNGYSNVYTTVFEVTINGTIYFESSQNNGVNYSNYVTFIVPNNATYSLSSINGGTISIIRWAELR